jgi:flagellar basal-body rod protein FlgF
MIRGLWTSAGALDPVLRAQEILANNLANAATSGYRQDRLTFQRLAASGAEGATEGAGPAETAVRADLTARLDLNAGAMESTGSPFHLAVSGPGFFVVQGPDGELYTRDGTLQRSADGTLLHRSGYPIMTEGGAITLPPGGAMTVAADGTVFVNGSAQGKLRLAALPDPTQVRHAGAGLVSSQTPGETDTTSKVIQGSLEGSNVEPVTTMVEMMSLLRAFEANQKAILTQDGSLGRLIQWAAG